MASVILLFPSYFLHKSVDVDWGVRLHLSHVFEFSLNAVSNNFSIPSTIGLSVAFAVRFVF